MAAPKHATAHGCMLLKPTLHVEVCVLPVSPAGLRDTVREWLRANYDTIAVGEDVSGYDDDDRINAVTSIEIADYTGPDSIHGFYSLDEVELDVQTYTLLPEQEMEARRNISQESETGLPPTRILNLPNVALKDEWNSLVFDDALPSRLLRYMTRMVGLMKQPNLNIATFNWNRLCLLHGPPGSGKSTLCRAVAQKLSIRLGDTFARAMLIEVNTNALLSKYFGESGKLIGATFENVRAMAQDQSTLICVVMDEIETIASSREKSTSGSECNDGLRATNQLLTALDRLRSLPNIIVLCTSNLLTAIDQAFLDRVDIKQLIPSPSPRAIYKIFRSCLNELVRSSLLDAVAVAAEETSSSFKPLTSPSRPTRSTKHAHFTTKGRQPRTGASAANNTSSSHVHAYSLPGPWSLLTVPQIPTFAEMNIDFAKQPQSAPYRVWTIAQKCEGFSGRTLRRLPILGLAMYTWGGSCSLDDAVSALEAAVDQELKVTAETQVEPKVKTDDIMMGSG